MRTNFHESYAGGVVEQPSDRSTGLLFAAVAVIVAVLWRNSAVVLLTALSIAVLLTAVSVIAPALLKPINLLWFQFGLLLQRLVHPIVMLALFAAVFVPAGAIMRLFRDPLRSRHARGVSTYWIKRKEVVETEGSMRNQF